MYPNFADGIIRSCVLEVEMLSVLDLYHSSPVGGTIVVFKLGTKFCREDTIGQPSTKTLMILPCLVTVAKEKV